MDWKRTAAATLLLWALALPAQAANITPQTTMKEIRQDPDIRDSGLYTYTYVWERDCSLLSTSRDEDTLQEVVGAPSAQSCAAGLNYLAQVYHEGTRITYPLYTPEEIQARPSRKNAEVYYCPAREPGAKFAVVLSGNALVYSGELRGGVSTAWELHQQGYAVFALRYSIGSQAGDDAPLEDLARTVRLVLDNAETFGVSTQGYAVLGYSSGGQIAGVFGSQQQGWGKYGLPRPGLLILAYPINNFAEARPAYRLLMDAGTLQKRYYSYTISDLVGPDYPAVFLWYGRNDRTLKRFGFDRQDEELARTLKAQGVPCQVEVYDNARHGVGIGVGTDAEGWVARAAQFWRSLPDAES